MDSLFNQCWAYVIVDSLIRNGVNDICIAPGSRSTPLTNVATFLQQQNKVTCHPHFDERGLGFYALGLAKATKKPVAVIVTSGTAVANLYPALIEASQTNVQLIVLSADRPTELIDCGANQAINQINIFADFPRAKLHLPDPSTRYSAAYVASEVDKCFLRSAGQGPIHINVPFFEPLYYSPLSDMLVNPWLTDFLLNEAPRFTKVANTSVATQHLEWKRLQYQKGIIVVGKTEDVATGLVELAETLGWPIFTDIQSGLQNVYPHADMVFNNNSLCQALLKADVVLQFGYGLVNRNIQNFLATYQGKYFVIDTRPVPYDQARHQLSYFKATVQEFLQAHQPSADFTKQDLWLPELKEFLNTVQDVLPKAIKTDLSELSLAMRLPEMLDTKTTLFLGNSSFIRFADGLANFPRNYTVYSNRGVSGIDGILATIAGVASTQQDSVLAVLGDISALHDLNSMALLAKVHVPTIILIINNNGGAIFNRMPVNPDIKEDYYLMPQNVEFNAIASMFHVPYYKLFTWVDFLNKLPRLYKRQGVSIVEVKAVDNAVYQEYKNLLDAMGTIQFTNSVPVVEE